MADTIVLEATKRDMTGKGVKKLRMQGIIPGVLYGPEFESVQVQVKWADLRPTLRTVGGSQIIMLNVDGENYNALVRDVQRAPLRGDVLHIDFYRVRMDVVIRTDVPLVLVGDHSAIEDAGGVISQEMSSIEVECLPTVLPSEIEVDLSLLEGVGDSLLVSALPELDGVTYMIDPDVVIVSSRYLQVREEEEEVEEEIEESVEPELIRRREDEEDEV